MENYTWTVMTEFSRVQCSETYMIHKPTKQEFSSQKAEKVEASGST